jgi:hypothetical protein
MSVGTGTEGVVVSAGTVVETSESMSGLDEGADEPAASLVCGTKQVLRHAK